MLRFLTGTRLGLIRRSSSVGVESKWDLISAVSLERLPIVCRELKDVETKFSSLLNRIEKERSHKSNFELRMIKDAERAQAIEKGLDIDLDSDQTQRTAQDFWDASTDELTKFKFASKSESPAIENDPKSCLRAKDRRLLLLVGASIGEQIQWLLPQGKHRPDEPSLRTTAERVLSDKCGSHLNVRWLGNAPFGFYKYKYPRAYRKEAVGAKVFFFKAQLINGSIDSELCSQFKWATRNELNALHQQYRRSVLQFLVDEEH